MDGNYKNNRPDEDYKEDSLVDEPQTSQENYKSYDQEAYRQGEVNSKKKKKSFRGSLLSYIIVVLIASIIGGLVSPYIGFRLYGDILPEPETNRYVGETINISPSDDMTTVTAVAKKAMSSVVGVTTIEEVQIDDMQRFLFGAFGPFEPKEREGVGSGVIVDRDGYILTNSHVIADGRAKSVSVLFENGDKEKAQVIWNDSLLDLAVIKVNKTGLPVAELGDSDNLEIGELAVAIGNPLGLEFQRTVTDGIISGLNRNVRLDQGHVIEDLIQTNASINPGNSGGPLLNNKGQVIGINTAKIKGGEGLGFAIPINKAKIIVEEVVETGSYETVILGISSTGVKDYEALFGVDFNVEKGIIVVQVHGGTPAHRAGLLNGDIIRKLDDIEIHSTNDLKKALYKYRKGDSGTLSIIRNGEEMNIEVEFTDLN